MAETDKYFRTAEAGAPPEQGSEDQWLHWGGSAGSGTLKDAMVNTDLPIFATQQETVLSNFAV